MVTTERFGTHLNTGRPAGSAATCLSGKTEHRVLAVTVTCISSTKFLKCHGHYSRPFDLNLKAYIQRSNAEASLIMTPHLPSCPLGRPCPGDPPSWHQIIPHFMLVDNSGIHYLPYVIATTDSQWAALCRTVCEWLSFGGDPTQSCHHPCSFYAFASVFGSASIMLFLLSASFSSPKMFPPTFLPVAVSSGGL